MRAHSPKSSQKKNRSAAKNASEKQQSPQTAAQLTDNRPEAIAQRKLKEVIDNSPRAQQLRSFQEMADSSPKGLQAAQLKAMTGQQSMETAQLMEKENKEPIQGKFASVQKKSATASEENNTGLPDNLKAGVENLSGEDMSDVKVHYNSDKPAQLNAHAYAQGTDIHVASGQEKHLPHEAWHVVQQKQGRVKPTTQLKGKVPINDDPGLEKEADLKGQEALKMGTTAQTVARQKRNSTSPAVQRKKVKVLGNEAPEVMAAEPGSTAPVQRQKVKVTKTAPLYNFLGEKTDEVSEGTTLDVSDKDIQIKTGKRLFYIASKDKYIEGAAFAVSKEEESSDGLSVETPLGSYGDGVVAIPIWGGHTFTFDTRSGKTELSGDIPEKKIAPKLPSISPTIDIPFAPGAHISVGLEVTPSLGITIGGGTYTVTPGKNPKVAISGTKVAGNMSLEITVKAGVAGGVANVVGVGAGAFVTAGGEAKLTGTLGGDVTLGKTPVYNAVLDLNASADITGKIGAYVEGSILAWKATKKFPLGEKTFAHYAYKRNIQVSNEGSPGSMKPTLKDFTQKEFGKLGSGKTLTVDGKQYQELVDETY